MKFLLPEIAMRGLLSHVCKLKRNILRSDLKPARSVHEINTSYESNVLREGNKIFIITIVVNIKRERDLRSFYDTPHEESHFLFPRRDRGHVVEIVRDISRQTCTICIEFHNTGITRGASNMRILEDASTNSCK